MLRLEIPQDLSQIIQKNRHELELKKLDVSALKPRVNDGLNGSYKGEIEHAHIVQFNWLCKADKPRGEVHIFGYHKSMRCAYSTSQIVAAASDMSSVQTRSGSLYKIADFAEGDMPEDLLLHVCAAMHSWRIGDYFGVLHVFY